jgi:sugar lactone lactonase YvrE
MMKFVVPLIALASTLSLSGCGGAGSTMDPALASHPLESSTTRNLVYVSDQLQKAVLVFPAGERVKNPSPVQTIRFGVIPEGLWVDRGGNLYVALSGQPQTQSGTVEEFKPGATTPFRTITSGISVPQNLIVDAQGTLYVDQVVDTTVQILEYPAGATSPKKTLEITDKGEPLAGGLALDEGGNLYVHAFFVDDSPSRVFRFKAGKTAAQDLGLVGLGDATGLTSDASGNLDVANAAGGISVYPPGQIKPVRKIALPARDSFAGFVATRSGKLYVAQENAEPSSSSLLEYPIGGSAPVNTISGHLQAPVSAALRAAAF